jgi:membrane protein required for beta-lactamase induction
MVYIAILMGLAIQAFTQGGFPWQSASVWAYYLRPFQGWQWFGQQPLALQVVLILMPVALAYLSAWLLLAGLFWGLGALALLVITFGLCCDGYRYIDYMGRFADPSLSGVSGAGQAAALYEHLLQRAAPTDESRLRDTVLCDCITFLILTLFTPLFWFVCLGPFVGLGLALTLAIATQSQFPKSLEHRFSTLLHWASWLPARVFSLTFFCIQSDGSSTVRQWWSLVKRSDQPLPRLVEVSVELSLVRVRGIIVSRVPSLAGQPSTSDAQSLVAVEAWPSADFADAQGGCQRAVLVWLAGIALFSLLL